MAFRLIYLHFTLANSTGQCQRVYTFWLSMFDNRCEIIYDKHCNCQLVGSCRWPFNWYIYVWPWPTLKVKVKFTHTFQLWIFDNRWQLGQTLQLPTHKKSHVDFRLAYLHFMLARLKVKVMHISTENDDRLYYCFKYHVGCQLSISILRVDHDQYQRLA